jgi:probable selenium-dependent hydroxylase accessory protein YqeC
MNRPYDIRCGLTLKEAIGLSDGGVVSIVGAGGKTSLMYFLSRELSMEGAPVLATTTTKIKISESKLYSKRFIIPADSCINRNIMKLEGKKPSPHFAASGEIPGEQKMVGFSPELIGQLQRLTRFRWIIVEADGACGKPIKAPAFHEPVIPDVSKWIIAMAGLDAIGKPLNDETVFRTALFSRLTGLKIGENISEESVARSLVHPEGLLKGSPKDSRRIIFLNKADCQRRIDAGIKTAREIFKTRERIDRVIIGRLMDTPSVIRYYENLKELDGL